jgi:carbamate kinase
MTHESKTIVVALGGNAISHPSEEGTIEQQFARTRHTVKVLCDAVQRGHRLVITHGNGPQVGNILRRAEVAYPELYMVPLDICVADTQAGMGYMICQCLENEMHDRGMDIPATTIVTSVVVDAEDEAFVHPTKPIGSPMDAEQAKMRQEREGWQTVQIPDGRYRRVVASPPPVEIVEFQIIKDLIDAGNLVVSCGGGGIPVVRDAGGHCSGAAAVIDKDRTSALLARQLEADMLVILTAVDRVKLNFGTDDEVALDSMTIDEARKHFDEGQFPKGSMGPKVQSAIDFVEHSKRDDAVAVIAELDKLIDALDGTSGTRIVRS